MCAFLLQEPNESFMKMLLPSLCAFFPTLPYSRWRSDDWWPCTCHLQASH